VGNDPLHAHPTLPSSHSPAAPSPDRAASGALASTPGHPRPFAAATEPQESTVNAKEAKKFAKLAGEWWSPTGAFRALHQLNPTRCAFIRDSLCDHYGMDASTPHPLAGLRLLDVGCGGGILAEGLARLGAEVHGIDVNQAGIDAAEAHAALDPEMARRLRYSATTVEAEAAAGHRYDAVVASEVIEHVASVSAFCSALVGATAPGGAVILSTLNRTLRAWALAVVAAERVLRWAPPGTHEWDKFLTPEEMVLAMEEAGERGGTGGGAVALEQISGMIFDPLVGRWGLGRDVGINYIAYFRVLGHPV
jgi:polyprenyldihydroxybenzoate methyltransferase/3-demethylubiquinol 3-O-methyltransferase